MSTGLECFFIEVEKDEWYYILEDYDSPKNAWNWLDYATAYGSFTSFDKAHNHLSDSHPNPGGYSKMEFNHFNKLSESQKEMYTYLTKNATRNL